MRLKSKGLPMPDDYATNGLVRTFTNPHQYWTAPNGRRIKVTPEEFARLEKEAKKGKDAAPK